MNMSEFVAQKIAEFKRGAVQCSVDVEPTDDVEPTTFVLSNVVFLTC